MVSSPRLVENFEPVRVSYGTVVNLKIGDPIVHISLTEFYPRKEPELVPRRIKIMIGPDIVMRGTVPMIVLPYAPASNAGPTWVLVFVDKQVRTNK